VLLNSQNRYEKQILFFVEVSHESRAEVFIPLLLVREQ
jgi:hypothetical protein